MTEPDREPAWRHLARYGAVGLLNTIVYWGGFVALDVVSPYLVAHLAAFAVAMTVSYFANTLWTFRVQPSWRTFLAFPLTNVPNFLATTVGVVLIIEWTSIPSDLAPLVAAAAAVPATYLLMRLLLHDGTRRHG